MKIGITGSRDFTDKQSFKNCLDNIINSIGNKNTAIIAGGCAGADTLAKNYAFERGLEYIEYLPKFKTDKSIAYHPRYYLDRNKEIVNACDLLVAFYDGKSKGTGYTINYAQKTGKKYLIIDIKAKNFKGLEENAACSFSLNSLF